MSAYSSTILRIIAFVLRVWHQDIGSPAAPFPFLWRGTQKDVVTLLHSKTKGDGPPTISELQVILHEFLVAVFKGAINLKTPIASVLEQGLLFLAIHPMRGWDRPSVLQMHLKHILYFSRIVKVHVAFLGDFALPYAAPFTTSSEEMLDDSIMVPEPGLSTLFDFSGLEDTSPRTDPMDETQAIMYVLQTTLFTQLTL